MKIARTQQFSARGYDQYNNEVPISPTWSTNVGSIDDSGWFTTQNTPDSGYVKATADSIEGQATVNIVDHPGPQSITNATWAKMMAVLGFLAFAITLAILLRKRRGKGSQCS